MYSFIKKCFFLSFLLDALEAVGGQFSGRFWFVFSIFWKQEILGNSFLKTGFRQLWRSKSRVYIVELNANHWAYKALSLTVFGTNCCEFVHGSILNLQKNVFFYCCKGVLNSFYCGSCLHNNHGNRTSFWLCHRSLQNCQLTDSFPLMLKWQ